MSRKRWLAVAAAVAGLLIVVLWYSFRRPRHAVTSTPPASATRPTTSTTVLSPRATTARAGLSMVKIGEYPENVWLDVVKTGGFSPHSPIVSPASRHVALVGVFSEPARRVDSKTGAVSDTTINRTALFIDGRRVESLSSLIKKKSGDHAIVFSPDGERWMYAAEGSQKKATVYLDGQRSEEYESIWPESLTFSPDSRRWAYVARQRGKWWMIIDGRTGPEADSLGLPIFSPDSSRVAYWRRNGPDWQVVADGKLGPIHSRIQKLHYSRDSQHLLYLARQSDGAKGFTDVVYRDGREVGRYRQASEVMFFDSHFALRYQGMWVAVDGKEFGPYGMDWKAPVFSKSGEHYVFSALMAGTDVPSHQTIKDGQVISSYEVADLAIADSGRVGLLACTKSVEMPPKMRGGVLTGMPSRFLYQVLIDGHPVSRHYELSAHWPDEKLLVFSEDGKHWAAKVALDDERSVVLLDGREGPPFVPDSPFVIWFAGPTLLYTVSTEQDERVFVNNVPGPDSTWCGDAVATTDGRRWACAYERQDDKTFVVVDGTSYETTGRARGLGFSPDGLHVAWREERWVVLDGRRGAEFDWVSMPCFEADGTLCYLARKGRSLFRVSFNGPASEWASHGRATNQTFTPSTSDSHGR